MDDARLLIAAAVLVLIAGIFSAADAALSAFSRARAGELVAEGRAGAKRLVAVVDDPARYVNTVLLLRMLCEIGATVLAALWAYDTYQGRWWPTVLTTTATMTVVSFVVIGVGPRTLGRQHHEGIALAVAGPIGMITTVLGPIPTLLIMLGNALTPGKGFRKGPFSTETELRELVDIAEASDLIEADERRMIHSVFELGDTSAREVMVPRGDIVFLDRRKTLRQALSLFLRSGFSRMPVIDDSLDDIIGMVYLKDVVARDFEAPEVETTQRVESLMRKPTWVPDSKPVDELLAEMQQHRQHIAVVVDEYGGTAGLVTIEDILEEIVGEITDEYDVEDREPLHLGDGSWRVPARFLVSDLEELIGFPVEEDDVDSVRGLMAKHLGLVPIPGSDVDAYGLHFEAEESAGRRNKIGTVRISVVAPVEAESETASHDGGDEQREKPDRSDDKADDRTHDRVKDRMKEAHARAE
ncbi:CBS domain containing-hemolysin-like protein [Nocardioides albertanoniae]|uniref:CBS domain containing-hemolysin-like protein n=1 Tax=Nocardioides albertanoniae TaxID=1175486 RepID=A0A543A554_9ACTN|nr:hemolysin family protein [Nocardioides albertanoniae]TQL67731.1 CBS domain containing-hemolysin-like protein [Nocardioides albertanoniae]